MKLNLGSGGEVEGYVSIDRKQGKEAYPLDYPDSIREIFESVDWRPVGSMLGNQAGVYCIRNMVSGRYYVGSAKNFRARAWKHWNDLKKNQHHNRHMQFSWNKYGDTAFVIGILEAVEYPTTRLLASREDDYFKILEVFRRGYNDEPAVRTHPHSAETRAIISRANKGRTAWNKGLPCPEHVIRRSIEVHTGRVKTDVERQKLSAAMLGPSHPFRGKLFPEPMRRKMSVAKHKEGPRTGRFKGVYKDQRTRTFMARLYDNGTNKFLGRYRTEEEAAAAYNKAALELYGPHCYMNDVSQDIVPQRRLDRGRPRA